MKYHLYILTSLASSLTCLVHFWLVWSISWSYSIWSIKCVRLKFPEFVADILLHHVGIFDLLVDVYGLIRCWSDFSSTSLKSSVSQINQPFLDQDEEFVCVICIVFRFFRFVVSREYLLINLLPGSGIVFLYFPDIKDFRQRYFEFFLKTTLLEKNKKSKIFPKFPIFLWFSKFCMSKKIGRIEI